MSKSEKKAAEILLKDGDEERAADNAKDNLKTPDLELGHSSVNYSKLICCNRTRFFVGVLLISLQTTVSILILVYDSELRKSFSFVIGFPGMVNGVNVLVYALHFQVRLLLIRKTAREAIKEDKALLSGRKGKQILWDGLDYKTWVRAWILVFSLVSIALAIAFMVLTAVGIMQSFHLMKKGTYPVLAEVCLSLHIMLQLCGFIAMNTFVEGIQTVLQLTRGCCDCCYPLPLRFGSEKKYKPLVLR